jgi:hypothetical protein
MNNRYYLVSGDWKIILDLTLETPEEYLESIKQEKKGGKGGSISVEMETKI